MTTGISKVGVVGCGIMGAGFAEICVLAGVDVIVAVSHANGLERGRQRVLRSIDNGVRKGRIAPERRDEALARLSFTTDLTALFDRGLVLEAVPEREEAKIEVFAILDKVVEAEEAVLASVTSSLPIVRMAQATRRPGNVVGLHFFNPPAVLPLVEVVGSLLTAEETCAAAESFVVGVLGKQVIRCQDRPGFVVNALLVPYLLAAARMVESGFATAPDIDKGMTLGCSHPMGPLALIDLIGTDTVVAAGHAMYDEFKDHAYAPPIILVRMVEAGRLGRKSGRGFYEYPKR